MREKWQHAKWHAGNMEKHPDWQKMNTVKNVEYGAEKMCYI